MEPRAMPQRGQRLRVHYHIKRGDFSVVDPRTGRVLVNVPDVTLEGAVLRVQPAGLARIRREKQRKVCAYVVGTLAAACSAPDLSGWRKVAFNPYRDDFFMLEGAPLREAALIAFAGGAGWVPPAP